MTLINEIESNYLNKDVKDIIEKKIFFKCNKKKKIKNFAFAFFFKET